MLQRNSNFTMALEIAPRRIESRLKGMWALSRPEGNEIGTTMPWRIWAVQLMPPPLPHRERDRWVEGKCERWLCKANLCLIGSQRMVLSASSFSSEEEIARGSLHNEETKCRGKRPQRSETTTTTTKTALIETLTTTTTTTSSLTTSQKNWSSQRESCGCTNVKNETSDQTIKVKREICWVLSKPKEQHTL